MSQGKDIRFVWRSFKEEPIATGRYIVAHRGVANIRYYLHPKDIWGKGTKTGWQGDVSWRPTHWAALPDTPEETDILTT